MIKVAISEFRRNIGKYKRLARKEPVEITRRGKRESILMSTEQYDWMWAKSKRSLRTEETPPTIIEAVRRAKMHPRHNHLNKLLK
jgi:prevent-host-death family protein